MASRSRTLYTGVTSDLQRRAYEDKKKILLGFTAKYNIETSICFGSGKTGIARSEKADPSPPAQDDTQ